MNKYGRIKGVPNGRKVYYLVSSGKRFLDVINAKNINLTDLSRATKISRATVWNFIYNGMDISSARLAKICAYCGVSTDYILGLREA